jgi:prophage regulatory protein
MAAITQIQPKETHAASNSSIQTQIRFVRKKEVTHRTGLPSSTIYDLMNRGLFPKSIKLAGGKAIAWLESDIEAWLKQCLEQSTSQGAA